MEQQIATNPEQSRSLISCGLDAKTADMVWLNRGSLEPYIAFNVGCNQAMPEVGDIPAWSLSALIDVFLTRAPAAGKKCKQFTIRISKRKDASIVDYEDPHAWVYPSSGATPINAVVGMIEKLIPRQNE